MSTIDDYMAFAKTMLGGGGTILSRASVELMSTNQLTAEQTNGGVSFGVFDRWCG